MFFWNLIPSTHTPLTRDSADHHLASYLMTTATIVAVVGAVIALITQNTLALIAFLFLGVVGYAGFWVLKELQVLASIDDDMRHIITSTQKLEQIHREMHHTHAQFRQILHTQKLRETNIFLHQDPDRIRQRNETLQKISKRLDVLLERFIKTPI